MKFDDIIMQSRPISKRHLPMPIADRAAQFAAFAALTGHEGAIEQTAEQSQIRADHVEVEDIESC